MADETTTTEEEVEEVTLSDDQVTEVEAMGAGVEGDEDPTGAEVGEDDEEVSE